MLQEVLALRRKVLGPEHPDTLLSMHYLSTKLANPDEILAMREEVLAARRKVLGSEHPDTLNALVNLSASFQAAGRRAEAIKLQEEAVTLACKLYGLRHPSTATVMRNLMASYAAMGDTAKAKALEQELILMMAQPFWANQATNSQVARLYESGLKQSDLEKLADGTWSVYFGRTRNLRDLSVLRLAPPSASSTSPLRLSPISRPSRSSQFKSYVSTRRQLPIWRHCAGCRLSCWDFQDAPISPTSPRSRSVGNLPR